MPSENPAATGDDDSTVPATAGIAGVGIGASAGGLRACRQPLSTLSAECGRQCPALR